MAAIGIILAVGIVVAAILKAQGLISFEMPYVGKMAICVAALYLGWGALTPVILATLVMVVVYFTWEAVWGNE